MKITPFFLLLIPISLMAQTPEGHRQERIRTIAFGSCSDQEKVDKQLWNEVNKERPDVWIWLGDNIYGDTEDMSEMWSDYEKQMSHPGYKRLMRQTEIFGIWDDHDYGINDGGWDYPMKDQSRDLLFDFVQLEKDHPAWQRKGAYQAHTFDFDGKRVKILLVDARYFRHALKKSADGQWNLPNYDGKVLDKVHWDWLEQQLKDDETDLFIIGSGIQVLAKDHRFEKWSNFPNERNKLLSMIQQQVKCPAIFISGDRHISEVSKLDIPDYEFPLYDITSSSLTHGWSERRVEKNELRVGEITYEENFAVLEIKWPGKNPELKLRYVGKDNELLQEFTFTY